MDYICKPKDYTEWKMVKDTCSDYKLCDVFYDNDENSTWFNTYPYIIADWMDDHYYIQGSRKPHETQTPLTVREFLHKMSDEKFEPLTYCQKHNFV